MEAGALIKGFAEQGILGLIIIALIIWILRKDKAFEELHVRLLAEAAARLTDADKHREILMAGQEKTTAAIHKLHEYQEKLEELYERRSPSNHPGAYSKRGG